MAINSNELRFATTSILPLTSSGNWTFNSASVDGSGGIIIQPGGSAICEATQTILNAVFQYFKVYIKYESNFVSPANNFKTGPYIFVTESYKNEENVIYKNISRGMGLNTFNLLDADLKMYDDTTIFRSLNKPMAYYYFKIVNDSDEVLKVRELGVFTSIDVSPDQIGGVINDINTSSDPAGFKVYVNDNYTYVKGLGVLLANSDKELKYKKVISGGLLSSIETNFNVSYPIVYVTDDIDLET